MGSIVPLLVALLAVAAYFLGIFDRPAFVYQDSLLSDSETLSDLVTIVAVSTSKDISGEIFPLMKAAESAIMALPNGSSLMEAAAVAYGNGADEKLAIGLYFDDPTTHSSPRWAIGYAVQIDHQQARLLAAQGAAATGMTEGSLKAVRLVAQPPNRIMKYSIPWRTFLTPMMAPMIHWPRVMSQYQRDHDGTEAQLAVEVYVKGKNDSYKTIDYFAYPDASIPLSDAFGVVDESEAAEPVESLSEETDAAAAGVTEERMEEEVEHEPEPDHVAEVAAETELSEPEAAHSDEPEAAAVEDDPVEHEEHYGGDAEDDAEPLEEVNLSEPEHFDSDEGHFDHEPETEHDQHENEAEPEDHHEYEDSDEPHEEDEEDHLEEDEEHDYDAEEEAEDE